MSWQPVINIGFICLTGNGKLEMNFEELCQYIFCFIVSYCLFTVISKIPTWFLSPKACLKVPALVP
jgi:hypothetical protein